MSLVGANPYPVAIHEASWLFRPDGADPEVVSVPIAYSPSNKPQGLFLTGFAEENVEGIARGLGERGIDRAVLCTPYPLTGELTPDVMETAILQAVRAGANFVRQRAGLAAEDRIEGNAVSQGGGELILAAYRMRGIFKSLKIGAPFGVIDLEERALRRRVFDWLKQSSDPNEVQALPAREKVAQLFNELRGGVKLSKRVNGAGMLAELEADADLEVMVSVGEDDIVFLPQEYAALPLRSVEVVHGVAHYACSSEAHLDQVGDMIRHERAASV